MGYDFNMKVLILVALLALALAKPDGERRPRPRPDDGDEDRPRPPRPDPPRPEPKGPAIFTKRVHKVAVGDDLVFSFAVASNQEEALDTSKVLLMKVSRGENGPDFSETDFAIKMKALTQEEIKEYYDQKKAEMEKKKDDMEEALKCMEPEPRPRPFKQVIVGKVAVKNVDCDDFSKYLIKYRGEDTEKGERRNIEKGDRRRPRPSKGGGFIILVDGCKTDDEVVPVPVSKRSAEKRERKDGESGRRPKPDGDKDGKDRKDGGKTDKGGRKDGEGGRRPKPDGDKDRKDRKDGDGGRRPKPDSDCDEDGKDRKDGKGGRRPRPDKEERKGDGEKEVSKRSDKKKW